MGTGGAADYRAGERILPDRYERKEISRWNFIHLGQSPWPSPSGPRPSHQETARQNCSLDIARTHQSTGDTAGAGINSDRTKRPEADILLRQRIDRSRGGPQNGDPVLAATLPKRWSKKYFFTSETGLPRRHDRGRQRRQHRAISCAIQIPTLPNSRSRATLLLSLSVETNLPCLPAGLR